MDAYDSVAWAKGEVDSLLTMRSPTSGPLIALMRDKDCQSVLDIGCGAGAFYHLLSKTLPEIRYQGVDISHEQVKRARKNFGDRFRVQDVSALLVKDFANFDAVHIYSVLPFMSVQNQLKTIERVLRSGAWTIIEIGTTRRDVRYAPKCAFKNLGRVQVKEMQLLTAVAWPVPKRDITHRGSVRR